MLHALKTLNNVKLYKKIIEMGDLKRILYSTHLIFVEVMQVGQNWMEKNLRKPFADLCRSRNFKFFLLDRDAYIKTSKDEITGNVLYPNLKYSK